VAPFTNTGQSPRRHGSCLTLLLPAESGGLDGSERLKFADVGARAVATGTPEPMDKLDVAAMAAMNGPADDPPLIERIGG